MKLKKNLKYIMQTVIATCVMYDINLYLYYSCDVLDLQRADIDFNDLDH